MIFFVVYGRNISIWMSGQDRLKVFEICSVEFEVVRNAFAMVFRGALVGKELRYSVMVGKASVLGQHPNGMGRQWSRIAYRFLPADRQYMDAGTKSSTTNLGTDS